MPDKDMMAKPNASGWLMVKLDNGTVVSIPEYCHVKLHKTAGGRDHITIMEGSYALKSASVTAGNIVARQHGSKAVVSFFLKSKVITWPGRPAVVKGGQVSGGIRAFTQDSNKIPVGQWDIEVPDFPHDLGDGYTKFANHARTWFRIASPGARDRFIHVGTVSLGCATVGTSSDKTSPGGQAALRDFELLYAYLIDKRKSPGIVGHIQVQDN